MFTGFYKTTSFFYLGVSKLITETRIQETLNISISICDIAEYN